MQTAALKSTFRRFCLLRPLRHLPLVVTSILNNMQGPTVLKARMAQLAHKASSLDTLILHEEVHLDLLHRWTHLSVVLWEALQEVLCSDS